MVKHVRGRARSGNQEKGTTTRTRLDLQMKMDNARWVILVFNVKELNLSVMSKRMMILRLPDWIEQLMCSVLKSARVLMMDSTELPSLSTRVCDGYDGPAGTHKKFDQSTGEVLFAVGCRDDRPVADSGSVVSTCPKDYATSIPTEKVHYSMSLKVCRVA